MAKVRFSPAARADLKEIGRFSRREFGLPVAEKYLLALKNAFDVLRDHPESGSVREEFGSTIRCLTYRRHRAFYEIDGEVVLVLRIFHHARDVKRSLLK